MLQQRCWSSRATRSVSFDESYRDLPDLTRLIGSADLVVLPYDSQDQVTSGVLVDAVACGRPVIATAFPHAIELLSSGAGIVVPQRDAAALADVVRGLVAHPEHLEPDGRRMPASGAGHVVAGRGGPLRRARRVAADRRRRDGVIPPSPNFAHIVAMSDGIGTFEHAEYSVPRVAEGYCTDDMARVLIAVCREPVADEKRPRSVTPRLPLPGRRARRRRQGSQPAVRRRPVAWTAGSRGLLGSCDVGVRHRRGTRRPRTGCVRARPRRSNAGSNSARAGRVRCRSPRSAPPSCSTVDPRHRGARRLLSDAADTVGPPGTDPAWAWPEPRLTYANAALADTLIAAGSLLRRPGVLDDGLTALRWLLARETRRRAPVADPRRWRRAGRPAADVRPTADRGRDDGRRLRAGVRRDRLSGLARRSHPLCRRGSSASTTSAWRSATSTAAPATTGSAWMVSTATKAPSRRSRCSRHCNTLEPWPPSHDVIVAGRADRQAQPGWPRP